MGLKKGIVMLKRRILVSALLVVSVAFSGCKESGSEGDGGKTPACSEDSFKQSCVGLISYQVCEQSEIVTKSCPSGSVCKEGNCMTVDPGERVCDDDSYESECRDNGYTICTDGQLSTIPCVGGKICESGKCIEQSEPGGHSEAWTKPAMPETCNDDTMVPYCYDNIRLSCKNGKIVQTDCTEFGLACHYGECKATAGQPCTPTVDKNQCVGNTLITCDFENYTLKSKPCGDDICATVEGAAGCYTPCKNSAQSSDYNKYCWGIDAYVTARCVESDEHQYVISDIQKEEGDYYNYKDCPDDEFCSDGECAPRHSGFTDGCTSDLTEFCDRNIAYTCKKDWFGDYEMNAKTCGSDTCVVYQDKALCASSCTKSLEGVTRSYCHYDDHDISLASVTEVCQKIDNEYYWILTERKGCDECNEYTGKCTEDEFVCDDDGLNCYSPNVEKCDTSKDSERYRCVMSSSDRSGSTYRYYFDSVKEICKDGYWIDDDYESCTSNGCNVKTGKCFDHEEEELNEYCTDDTDYCSHDGYIIRCAFGTWKAILVSCGGGKCAQTGDSSFACVVPCSEEDVGKIVYSECAGADKSVYFECVKNKYGVGSDYYMIGHSEDCPSGCAEGSCRGKIHPDAGRVCSEDYQTNCVNDALAYCSGYYSPDVYAKNCRDDNQICVNSGEYTGCFDPCTEEDYNKQNLLCVFDEYSEHFYSKGRECLKTDDGRYFWTAEVDEYCVHGCDENTGKCLLIHELEGQDCAPSEDSKCDGKIKLSCSWSGRKYTAYDCEVELGKEAVCAMVSDDGDTYPYCIYPCDNIGDTKPVCKDEDRETQYRCVESKGVKHWEIDSGYEYCKHGCDTDTGKCVKLNEHEGESCNSNTDPEYCDGTKYVHCEWSEYKVADCTEQAENTSCALENGKTQCLFPCTKDELGNNQKQCGTGGKNTRLYNAVCTEYENGYFWKPDESNYITCDHGCDVSAKSCSKIVADEFERCDVNNYVPSCHDNYLVYCDKSRNKVVADECSSYKSCFSSDKYIADCYNVCEKSEVGSSSAYCGSGVLSVTTCTNVGDKYLELSEDTFCYHGCNDNKNGCLDSPYKVGDSCESLVMTKCADDSHYYVCKNDAIEIAECESGTVCGNRGWSDSRCEVPECTEGQVKYSCYGSNSHTAYTCRRSSYGSYSYSGTMTSSCASGCEQSTGLCY